MPGRKNSIETKTGKLNMQLLCCCGGIESIKLRLQLLVEEFPALVGAEKFRADFGRHLSSNHL
jgi:hypothetical protein